MCENRTTLEPNPNIRRMCIINESDLYSEEFRLSNFGQSSWDALVKRLYVSKRRIDASSMRWKTSTVDSKASTLFNGKVLERYNNIIDTVKDSAIIQRKDRMVILSSENLKKPEIKILWGNDS